MVAGSIVRAGLGAATVLFAVIGTVLGGDLRWYGASGLVGTMWWLWDFLSERVFQPLGASLARLFFEGGDLPSSRASSAEDIIQRLEARLDQVISRESDVQAALRLADLYRVVRDDDLRARAVVEMMKARYPDSPELRKYLEAVRTSP